MWLDVIYGHLAGCRWFRSGIGEHFLPKLTERASVVTCLIIAVFVASVKINLQYP